MIHNQLEFILHQILKFCNFASCSKSSVNSLAAVYAKFCYIYFHYVLITFENRDVFFWSTGVYTWNMKQGSIYETWNMKNKGYTLI